MGTRAQEASTRAVRFPVHMPVRYRLPQSREWFEARTENVSRTGVLFRGECTFKPATMVDVRLQVPPPNRAGDRAEVVCKCEVVRTVEAGTRSISPGVALTIHNYRLTRKRLPQ